MKVLNHIQNNHDHMFWENIEKILSYLFERQILFLQAHNQPDKDISILEKKTFILKTLLVEFQLYSISLIVLVQKRLDVQYQLENINFP